MKDNEDDQNNSWVQHRNNIRLKKSPELVPKCGSKGESLTFLTTRKILKRKESAAMWEERSKSKLTPQTIVHRILSCYSSILTKSNQWRWQGPWSGKKKHERRKFSSNWLRNVESESERRKRLTEARVKHKKNNIIQFKLIPIPKISMKFDTLKMSRSKITPTPIWTNRLKARTLTRVLARIGPLREESLWVK